MTTWNLIRSDQLCTAGETRLGYCWTEGADCCGRLCREKASCSYFLWDSTTFECWQSHAGSRDCDSGWIEARGVSFYALEGDRTPFTWSLVHKHAECASPEMALGDGLASTVGECAFRCDALPGCDFFLYDERGGGCFEEYTSSADCPEGLQTWRRYDFYALLRGSAAPIPLAERWSCVGPAPFPGEAASSAPRRTSTCFEYHAAPKRSWVGSEAACLSRGMHLASVHSAAENEVALSLCAEECWIGFTDRQSEGEWRWTDGSRDGGPHPWSPGEPNGQLHETTDGAYIYPLRAGLDSPGSRDDDFVNVSTAGPAAGHVVERAFLCRHDFRAAPRPP
ncbi:hypothetical protein EMIHUDRAFT_461821, partial [Emiliania huxleyi CCMP1516]|uniref:C-type lectin domain-containing protein n=2 Tax=Emiliania huxleyi TaxID=2903 RepID=A0A0D3I6Y5_EMIH1